MAEKTVNLNTDVATTGRSAEDIALRTRDEERYISPPVDIYETGDSLVVVADLPCVPKDGLDIRVDDDVLTIQGKTSYSPPSDVFHREFGMANFFRQFSLSEEVDQTKISAQLRNGVLTVQLPKAEKAKPKQIEVKLG
jgi:HSP20 family protein